MRRYRGIIIGSAGLLVGLAGCAGTGHGLFEGGPGAGRATLASRWGSWRGAPMTVGRREQPPVPIEDQAARSENRDAAAVAASVPAPDSTPRTVTDSTPRSVTEATPGPRTTEGRSQGQSGWPTWPGRVSERLVRYFPLFDRMGVDPGGRGRAKSELLPPSGGDLWAESARANLLAHARHENRDRDPEGSRDRGASAGEVESVLPVGLQIEPGPGGARPRVLAPPSVPAPPRPVRARRPTPALDAAPVVPALEGVSGSRDVDRGERAVTAPSESLARDSEPEARSAPENGAEARGIPPMPDWARPNPETDPAPVPAPTPASAPAPASEAEVGVVPAGATAEQAARFAEPLADGSARSDGESREIQERPVVLPDAAPVELAQAPSRPDRPSTTIPTARATPVPDPAPPTPETAPPPEAPASSEAPPPAGPAPEISPPPPSAPPAPEPAPTITPAPEPATAPRPAEPAPEPAPTITPAPESGAELTPAPEEPTGAPKSSTPAPEQAPSSGSLGVTPTVPDWAGFPSVPSKAPVPMIAGSAVASNQAAGPIPSAQGASVLVARPFRKKKPCWLTKVWPFSCLAKKRAKRAPAVETVIPETRPHSLPSPVAPSKQSPGGSMPLARGSVVAGWAGDALASNPVARPASPLGAASMSDSLYPAAYYRVAPTRGTAPADGTMLADAVTRVPTSWPATNLVSLASAPAPTPSPAPPSPARSRTRITLPGARASTSTSMSALGWWGRGRSASPRVEPPKAQPANPPTFWEVPATPEPEYRAEGSTRLRSLWTRMTNRLQGAGRALDGFGRRSVQPTPRGPGVVPALSPTVARQPSRLGSASVLSVGAEPRNLPKGGERVERVSADRLDEAPER